MNSFFHMICALRGPRKPRSARAQCRARAQALHPLLSCDGSSLYLNSSQLLPSFTSEPRSVGRLLPGFFLFSFHRLVLEMAEQAVLAGGGSVDKGEGARMSSFVGAIAIAVRVCAVTAHSV